MPGKGMNNEPILEFERFGKLRLNSHNHFNLIDNEYFHPLKFFVEPIIVSLNYIEQNFDYDDYYMVGHLVVVGQQHFPQHWIIEFLKIIQ